ncbi:hypothetical protein PV328_004963 [Microctonus aethiopoides]|uniref:Cytochrome P450 n=1 Tax=Microctonus aethiopoides TaxID=144406 RepID=A0AA39KMA2_9HYME|nr:hypothetical protein PV328_004963 [Microctonus aethiopoides]
MMMMSIVINTSTYILIVGAILVTFIMLFVDRVRLMKKKLFVKSETITGNQKIIDPKLIDANLQDPPGPKPWPIIGSLHILGQYDVPYKAFSVLEKMYNSPVIKLKLGSVQCVIINGLENIKEVLYTKGQDFDSRPNFLRYNKLFAGSKENSLAFCDWSDLQKTRREMLRNHVFPRAFTCKYDQLNVIIASEVENLLVHLDRPLGTMKVAVKPLVLSTCANIFTSYFCSRRFEFGNQSFRNFVDNFDRVFYEVNQGYAADFMPFLMPLHNRNMARVAKWAHDIRYFVVQYIIENRLSDWNREIPELDYVDCLINYLKLTIDPEMKEQTALFALEDVIGGHSAIGNFIMKVFGYLATRRHVQEMAQKEIDAANIPGNTVGLEYRHSMPYTDAIILETVRHISSPIVPHVASKDSSINGYKIEKDTFIFLNNYDLNMSEDLWNAPTEFIPERFIKNGRIFKPKYFLPFGGGRRSCMGYKLVQHICFSILASLLKNFTIVPYDDESYEIPIGYLALPIQTYTFRCEKR